MRGDARCRDHGGYHQDDGTPALGPRRPAEERPPHDDSQPAEEPAQHPVHRGFGHDGGYDKPTQPNPSNSRLKSDPSRAHEGTLHFLKRGRLSGACDLRFNSVTTRTGGYRCEVEDRNQRRN
jgi:hypothetical protein